MTLLELRNEIRDGCRAVEETRQQAAALEEIASQCASAERIYILGMGSSYWTGVMAGYLLRDVGGDATAVSSSEFMFTPHSIDENTLVLGFSQSGETVETIQAMQKAIDAGATSVAIINTPDSSLDELAEYSFVTPAGSQNAVLATKSVDTALTTAYIIADSIAGGEYVDLAGEADYCESMLDVDLSSATTALLDVTSLYTIGVGSGYGLAGEAATKLGEGPLVHTTPLPLLEIDHGPYANVKGDAVIVIATYPIEPEIYQDTIAMLQEAGAETIVISDRSEQYSGDVLLPLPAKSETILPATKVVQCLATNLGVERDVDVDHLPDPSPDIDLSIRQ